MAHTGKLSKADRAEVARQCPELHELLLKVTGVLHVTYGLKVPVPANADVYTDADTDADADGKSMSRRMCEVIRVTINEADDLVRCVDDLVSQPGTESATKFVRLRQELRAYKIALLNAGDQLRTLDLRKLTEEDEALAAETATDLRTVYADVFRILTGGHRLPKVDVGGGSVEGLTLDGFIQGGGGGNPRRRETVTTAQQQMLVDIRAELDAQDVLLEEASKVLATLHEQAAVIGNELAVSQAGLDSTLDRVAASQTRADSIVHSVKRAEKQARTRPWPVYVCCLSIFVVLAILFLRMLLH